MTKPTGVASGDLLVATFAVNSSTNPSSISLSGWTSVIQADHGSTPLFIAVLFKVAGGGEPSSYTFDFNGGSNHWGGKCMVRISGADTASPLTGTPASDNSGGSIVAAVTCPSITTDDDDSLIFRVANHDSGGTFSSTPSGTVVQNANASANAVGLSYATQAVAGATGTASWNRGSNSRVLGVTFAIAPAAGGGSTTIRSRHTRGLLRGVLRGVR